MSDKRTNTPEVLWPALRQYRHNTGGDEFLTAFDYDDTLKAFSKKDAEIKLTLEANKIHRETIKELRILLDMTVSQLEMIDSRLPAPIGTNYLSELIKEVRAKLKVK